MSKDEELEEKYLDPEYNDFIPSEESKEGLEYQEEFELVPDMPDKPKKVIPLNADRISEVLDEMYPIGVKIDESTEIVRMVTGDFRIHKDGKNSGPLIKEAGQEDLKKIKDFLEK